MKKIILAKFCVFTIETIIFSALFSALFLVDSSETWGSTLFIFSPLFITVFFFAFFLSGSIPLKLEKPFLGDISQGRNFLRAVIFRAFFSSFSIGVAVFVVLSFLLDPDKTFLENSVSSMWSILVIFPVTMICALLFLATFSSKRTEAKNIEGDVQCHIPLRISTYRASIFSIAFGIVLFWISLFLSYRELPFDFDEFFGEGKPNFIEAIGGFPLQVFEYPSHPLGNDTPAPIGWKIPFVCNILFWILIAFALRSLFVKCILHDRWLVSLIIFAIFISFFGKVYLLFLFD